jgi:diaminopimelate decarboxylase
MLRQLGEKRSGQEVTIRINPGFGHGHSRKTNTGGEFSKHGIWFEQLPEVLREVEELQLSITGLHMHIGSGTDFEHLAKVCSAMEDVAAVVGKSVRSISAGGGLPIPYRDSDPRLDVDSYFDLWNTTRTKLQAAFGHPIRLEIEPGRYLVAEAGFLVTEIRAVKKQADHVFYLVDAGFNNLARPVMYGAYHPISIVPRDGDLARPECDVIVGGPLCESGDIFTQEEGGIVVTRRLPQASVGDYLVIECAGAYGFVMGSNYNAKPFAAEVLIDRGRVDLIRRRQAYHELWQGESIPKIR